MSGRLPQRRIDALVNHVDGVFVNNTTTVALAREVQASRKLIADLRARHQTLATTERGPYNEPYEAHRCLQCGWVTSAHDGDTPRCPTLRMIDEAGL